MIYVDNKRDFPNLTGGSGGPVLYLFLGISTEPKLLWTYILQCLRHTPARAIFNEFHLHQGRKLLLLCFQMIYLEFPMKHL